MYVTMEDPHLHGIAAGHGPSARVVLVALRPPGAINAKGTEGNRVPGVAWTVGSKSLLKEATSFLGFNFVVFLLWRAHSLLFLVGLIDWKSASSECFLGGGGPPL